MLPKKAFFRVSIDYNWDARNKEGKRICLDSGENSNIQGQKILDETKKIISENLPHELKVAYGMRVKTKITHVTEGSIIVIFSAVFNFLLGMYFFIAKYPNFKDGCTILRDDLDRLINRMLKKHSEQLDASVTLISPGPQKSDGREVHTLFQGSNYFWPMTVSLIFNIVLFAFLLILVWKAVQRVYF